MALALHPSDALSAIIPESYPVLIPPWERSFFVQRPVSAEWIRRQAQAELLPERIVEWMNLYHEDVSHFDCKTRVKIIESLRKISQIFRHAHATAGDNLPHFPGVIAPINKRAAYDLFQMAKDIVREDTDFFPFEVRLIAEGNELLPSRVLEVVALQRKLREAYSQVESFISYLEELPSKSHKGKCIIL